MGEINQNQIAQIASKIGKFIIIGFIIEFVFVTFINDSLVNFLHNNGPLSKSDPIEIDMLIRSSQHTLSLIILALFIFKVNFKDMFLNKNQIYELSLKSKIKLTLLFISISLFFALISTFIMDIYTRYILNIPMPETAKKLSVFAIFIVPIIEEILYRGIFLNQLKGIGYLFSIIVSSIYFGAMHGIGFLHAFIIGLILGFTYILTGNIKWSIIIHYIYNLIIALIEYLFLPLFPNISHNTGKLIVGIVLFLVFLIVSIRDKELKELYEKVNIKNIGNKIKQDKNKYMTFVDDPKIIIFIVGGIIIQLLPFFVDVNILMN
ncbi:CPBP family intramembrane metalloprotease [Clostridium sp. D2Q-14]|uniref:CPBP family intramembrane glutamic endopeptidase n=1 Tax=Anaeromonas gelatinilytica TaxID=2683194 RepID=UPI00193C4A9F|nr:CPBP family intramembrane glutamic endopeptidase [Anaeromonas gelatinilytica]MBS4534996.1 CPBP family intramembrane metalloprotease [Anaeromonas gelatinilytica]